MVNYHSIYVPNGLVGLGGKTLGDHEGDITTDNEVSLDAVTMVMVSWDR